MKYFFNSEVLYDQTQNISEKDTFIVLTSPIRKALRKDLCKPKIFLSWYLLFIFAAIKIHELVKSTIRKT